MRCLGTASRPSPYGRWEGPREPRSWRIGSGIKPRRCRTSQQNGTRRTNASRWPSTCLLCGRILKLQERTEPQHGSSMDADGHDSRERGRTKVQSLGPPEQALQARAKHAQLFPGSWPESDLIVWVKISGSSIFQSLPWLAKKKLVACKLRRRSEGSTPGACQCKKKKQTPRNSF